MALLWKCAEHAAQVAGGAVALAVGIPDPGLVIAGGAGLVALTTVLADRFAGRKPDGERALARIREAVMAEFTDDIIHNRWPGADLNAADAALANALSGYLIDRKKLGALAVHKDGFVKHAAATVVDGVAQSHSMFAETGDPTCRAFALAVLEAALAAALDDLAFADDLHRQVELVMAQGVGAANEKLDSLLIELKAQAAAREMPNPTLVAAVRKFGEVRSDVTEAELIAHIERFADEYMELRAQVAALAPGCGKYNIVSVGYGSVAGTALSSVGTDGISGGSAVGGAVVGIAAPLMLSAIAFAFVWRLGRDKSVTDSDKILASEGEGQKKRIKLKRVIRQISDSLIHLQRIAEDHLDGGDFETVRHILNEVNALRKSAKSLSNDESLSATMRDGGTLDRQKISSWLKHAEEILQIISRHMSPEKYSQDYQDTIASLADVRAIIAGVEKSDPAE